MSIFFIVRRNAQIIGAALLLAATNVNAREPQPLFDAHIHFSVGATSIYTPAAALQILESSGIRTALLSSTPNDGTLALYAAYPQANPTKHGLLSDYVLYCVSYPETYTFQKTFII